MGKIVKCPAPPAQKCGQAGSSARRAWARSDSVGLHELRRLTRSISDLARLLDSSQVQSGSVQRDFGAFGRIQVQLMGAWTQAFGPLFGSLGLSAGSVDAGSVE